MSQVDLLIAILITALAASPLPLLLQRYGRGYAALASALVMATCLALLAPLVMPVMEGATLLTSIAWLPDWGLTLSLRLDGLGLMFSLLILGIGLLVTLYAYYYLPLHDRLGRFYTLLLLFMAAMLGVVLSENLLLLVVFWELTSLASFLSSARRRQRLGRHRAGARLGPSLRLVRLPAERSQAARPRSGRRPDRRCQPEDCRP